MANGQEFVSASDSRYRYDVFLSFRGKDTRNSFTDHLYEALVRAGNRTFRDEDEIRVGEHITSELVDAIQYSRCWITVFSKNYASSSWCLDELVTILARKHESESKHYFLPIFYGVDPTDIRRQSGIVGEAFDKHLERLKVEKDEGKVKERMEKINGWRAALSEAADLPGMVLLDDQPDRKEPSFIEKVVKVIRDNVRRPVFQIGPYLVGIRERAVIINKWLEDGSTDVNVIGVCGMGGIGKTTLAKFVYNQNSENFEGRCFLANVREMSKQPNGLVSLQSRFLSDVTFGKEEKIKDVDEGIVRIKYAIRGKKILLVVDDVDHQDQLNAIFGMQAWFFPGSKIIITTRHERLLKLPKVDKVYKVEKLTGEEAIKLMSFHSFGQEQPPSEDFMNHTKEAVRLCEGLPLALKVVSSSLSGRKVDYWASALRKLEQIPDSDILEKLRLSYDSLQDDHDKNLFLHIACFFVGQDKNSIVRILDECEFYTTVGIQNLIDRCLITTSGTKRKLMMHQLLQDMGREIVRQESPRYPGKRSRLWRHKESFDVLKKKTGTESIEGLAIDMQMLEGNKSADNQPRENHETKSFFSRFWGEMPSSYSRDLNIEIDAFARMRELKLLQINYVKLTGFYGAFPQELRWLCWHGFPLKAIPTSLTLNSVVYLDMQHSSLKQVWKGIRFLRSLKILNLSYSEWLVQTPNFSGIPKLERLILKGCVSLVEVCESIGVLEGLVILDLEDCKHLKKLPWSMSELRGLQTLNLSGCPNVMGSLGVLLADGIPVNSLGITSADIVSWNMFPWSWVVNRRNYANLSRTSLPHFLRNLHLSGCNLHEESFPQDLSSLSLLDELNLSNNSLQTLPNCIRTLGITILSIGSCPQLQSLCDLPETLVYLDIVGNPSLETITSSGNLKLYTLNYLECPKLAKIEDYFLLEDITEVDREITDNLGFDDVEELAGFELLLFDGISLSKERHPIQGFHEFGLFSTFVPWFVAPSWFLEGKVMGSSISFIVPTNVRIKCLNVCCLYRTAKVNDEVRWSPNPILVKINNKTKDLTWVYCPFRYCSLQLTLEDMAWLSQWKLGDDELGGGDQVTVTFAMGNSLDVTECGYNLVMFHEEEETEEMEVEHDYIGKKTKERGVIGGDLSDYQLSTGMYLLSRQSFTSYTSEEEEDWTTTTWSRNIFGDSISMEELNKTIWRGRLLQ